MLQGLKTIMDKHEHCVYKYVDPFEVAYINHPEILIASLREDLVKQSGIPPSDLTDYDFTVHRVDVPDSLFIVVLTADKRKQHAELQANH